MSKNEAKLCLKAKLVKSLPGARPVTVRKQDGFLATHSSVIGGGRVEMRITQTTCSSIQREFENRRPTRKSRTPSVPGDGAGRTLCQKTCRGNSGSVRNVFAYYPKGKKTTDTHSSTQRSHASRAHCKTERRQCSAQHPIDHSWIQRLQRTGQML